MTSHIACPAHCHAHEESQLTEPFTKRARPSPNAAVRPAHPEPGLNHQDPRPLPRRLRRHPCPLARPLHPRDPNPNSALHGAGVRSAAGTSRTQPSDGALAGRPRHHPSSRLERVRGKTSLGRPVEPSPIWCAACEAGPSNGQRGSALIPYVGRLDQATHFTRHEPGLPENLERAPPSLVRPRR